MKRSNFANAIIVEGGNYGSYERKMDTINPLGISALHRREMPLAPAEDLLSKVARGSAGRFSIL